MYSFNNNLLLF